MDAQTIARYDAFQTIFAEPAVDGNMASQRDRATLDNDTQALTYGEVEYLGFLDMLKLAAAKVSSRQTGKYTPLDFESATQSGSGSTCVVLLV
jgi:hypothetical protein